MSEVVEVQRSRLAATSIATTVAVDGRSYELEITADRRLAPAAPGDVWLPVALLVAMSRGSDLRLHDPVSRRLLRSVDVIQDILSTWHPGLQRVGVIAPASRRPGSRRAGRVMQTFTGGVDSYFSLITSPEVTDLVYLHDRVHDIPEVRTRMRAHLAGAAAAAGRELHQVEHHVRHLLDRYAEWGTQSHGAVIVACAAALTREPSTLRIPASNSYRELHPHGTHPLLDPLWSGDRLTVVHHGATHSRLGKVARIADDPGALAHLRVCWRTQSTINCGECEKCLRTMTALELVGRLGDSSTFPRRLDVPALAAAVLGSPGQAQSARELRDLAQARGRDDIAHAFEEQLDRYSAG